MIYIGIGICILLIMIYFKLSSLTFQKSNVISEIYSDEENNDIDADDDIDEDNKIVADTELMQISNDKKLKIFHSKMSKWKEFLNPSLAIDIEDVLEKLDLILDIDENSIEKKKISFLCEISLLILRNRYKFHDFKIDFGVYGKHFPMSHKIIRFDIENIILVKRDPDYIRDEYEADFIFASKNGKKIIIKHRYYEDDILSSKVLEQYFDKFEYVKYVDEKAKYNERYKEDDGKFSFSLDDLGTYIDFIGRNYYNKKFMTFRREDELFTEIKIIDNNWHPEKSTTFFYETMDEELKKELAEGKRDIINSMKEYDDFIFQQMIEKQDLLSMYDYCYTMYFNGLYDFDLQVNASVFKIIEMLDKLIELNYPLAYIFKAILHYDGILVLKDYEESKKLLKKAYNLGMYRPALMVWNDNNFS